MIVYVDMLQLMNPGESVAKALRRFGGSAKKMTTAQRLKAKKLGIKPTDEEIKNKELLQSLTGLADKLVQAGTINMAWNREFTQCFTCMPGFC